MLDRRIMRRHLSIDVEVDSSPGSSKPKILVLQGCWTTTMPNATISVMCMIAATMLRARSEY